MNEDQIETRLNEIRDEVAREWKMGGLIQGVWGDYAKEVARRFAQELDESEMSAPEALASRLIDVWIAEHNKQIPWATAVQIIAIVTKESDKMRDELLGFGDPSTPTSESIAKEIHYPKCWDTAAFPALEDAVFETVVATRFVCSECDPAGYDAALHRGVPAILTDEQILALAKKFMPSYEWEGSILDFARALLEKKP